MAIKGLKDVYLLAYNVAQTLGWGYVTFLLIQNYQKGGNEKTAWAATGYYLQIFQYAAGLEILHALFGFVRTPVMTTVIQVFSRFAATFIASQYVDARENWFYTSMVASWGITEIVRYSYYAFQLIGSVPSFLLWLRYTLFYILYPSGAGSEVFVFLHAAFSKAVYPKSQYDIVLPNAWNISFNLSYTLIALCLLYFPGFPTMYGHMISQRKRYLGSKPAPAKKTQ